MILFGQNKALSNSEKVLRCLINRIPDSTVRDGTVYLSKCNLTIETKIEKIDNSSLLKIADILFILKHPFFSEVYVESITGIGENIDKAIHKCVEGFLEGFLHCIRKCITNKPDECFETNFFGSKKLWSLYISNSQGKGYEKEKDDVDVWGAIGDKIKTRLGNKRVYFIKVYVSKHSNGEVISECYINEFYNYDISHMLLKCAENWKVKGNIFSYKQYFLIKQDDETYHKYEFSEEDVKEYTNHAIKILGNINSYENSNELDNRILNVTKNSNLAYEIRNLIPEILCEIVFRNVNYTDKITIISRDKAKKIKCYKNQFTSYNWIYNEVASNYFSNKISDEEIRKIVLLSSSYDTINNALNNGIKIQELNNVGISLYSNEEYVPV